MKRNCETCGIRYDDVDHSTICPHEYFEMRCVTVRADGTAKLCRSVEEVERFIGTGVTEALPPAVKGMVRSLPPEGETLDDERIERWLDAWRRAMHLSYGGTMSDQEATEICVWKTGDGVPMARFEYSRRGQREEAGPVTLSEDEYQSIRDTLIHLIAVYQADLFLAVQHKPTP